MCIRDRHNITTLFALAVSSAFGLAVCFAFGIAFGLAFRFAIVIAFRFAVGCGILLFNRLENGIRYYLYLINACRNHTVIPHRKYIRLVAADYIAVKRGVLFVIQRYISKLGQLSVGIAVELANADLDVYKRQAYSFPLPHRAHPAGA